MLPESAWARRHRMVLALLVVHAFGVLGYGVVRGAGVVHTLTEAAAVAVPGLVAAWSKFGRPLRAAAGTIGLVTASAVLVHLSGGLIEMHFHFFVMIGVIALYQSWFPFLLAIGYVAVHHGLMGALEPALVYNHAAAQEHPWRWAAVHAAFVIAASATSLMSWRVSEQALHDPLTGLANRSLFIDRVGHALQRGDRQRQPTTVLFIDLDNFKTVNDSLGHVAGDRLLVVAAERLQRCLRKSDTAARLGGDEFAMLLEDTTESAADVIAEKLLTALRRPLLVQNRELFIDASIGIATAQPGDANTGDLLRDADAAMYVAKRHGKARYEHFSPDMHLAALGYLELRADLQRAITRQEFVLHYQPIVALGTNAITGVEALVRWNHPTRGLLPPSEFIALAEETGLIRPLGGWVLTEACAQARSWHERYPSDPLLTMSVNISARQLHHPGFVEEIGRVLETACLTPSALVLEFTESILLNDADTVLSKLDALKTLGVQLAIDDFGTGYSSLRYLHRFPIDTLKIDRSFVGTVGARAEKSAVANSIIHLGRTFDLHMVAEGVESADQLTELQRLGCSYGQGYLFARPLDAASLDALLDETGRDQQGKDFPDAMPA
jgi:diguanylate cyclase (GGDEF)-like protein